MNEYLYRNRITLADEALPPFFGPSCGMRCRQRFTAQLRWRPTLMSRPSRPTRVVDRPISVDPERSLMVTFARPARPVGPERPGPVECVCRRHLLWAPSTLADDLLDDLARHDWSLRALRTAVSVRGVWLCLVLFDCVLMSLSQGSNQIFDPKEKKLMNEMI